MNYGTKQFSGFVEEIKMNEIKINVMQPCGQDWKRQKKLNYFSQIASAKYDYAKCNKIVSIINSP